jgi:hypothetical protein
MPSTARGGSARAIVKSVASRIVAVAAKPSWLPSGSPNQNPGPS